jgi:isochorismate pyruvate lyase
MNQHVMNLKSISDRVKTPYANFILSEINESCLRLAVNEGTFKWHYHSEADELFLLLEGQLVIEFRDREAVTLSPGEAYRVGKGTIHRTIARGRTVNLCFERTDADTIFVDEIADVQLNFSPTIAPTIRVTSGAPWEKKVGYCRAIRRGNQIAVSGTAPIGEDGKTFEPGNAYEQAKRCLVIIQAALRELGTDLSAVTRTRLFVTDISRWEEYGRAHGEAFGEFPPATTMVEVKSLIAADMLVEIEADAIVET